MKERYWAVIILGILAIVGLWMGSTVISSIDRPNQEKKAFDDVKSGKISILEYCDSGLVIQGMVKACNDYKNTLGVK
jgi:hypothetical protein